MAYGTIRWTNDRIMMLEKKRSFSILKEKLGKKSKTSLTAPNMSFVFSSLRLKLVLIETGRSK